ncbi:Crp/Fnr family transcriptional regulator [Candidatus Peregrinibacteria bacterium]|nr:Crp/Fnr family transcriptional regulator [Candidatus Peregrinibacteria bacterium]
MTQNKAWYLQQADLFKGISDEEIMQIAEKVVEKRCTKKELIYSPFEPSSEICLLKKGEVTLYHSHYGKKLIIEVLKPGSIFGNINFSNDNQSDHFAEVTEEAYICYFTVDDFMKVLQAKPEVMLRFLQMMSQRITEYEERIKSGLFDAKEKVLHHLEIIEKKNSKSFLGKIMRKKHLTHEELAAHTGLSRETVTRAIGALKKEGKIPESLCD